MARSQFQPATGTEFQLSKSYLGSVPRKRAAAKLCNIKARKLIILTAVHRRAVCVMIGTIATTMPAAATGEQMLTLMAQRAVNTPQTVLPVWHV